MAKTWRILGDHQIFILDIPACILLGKAPLYIPRHTTRRLVFDQPEVVKRYNHHLNKQLQNQHVITKFMVYKKEETITDQQSITQLHKIDKSITNAFRCSEKRWRKLKFGALPFEPESNAAGKIINVWNNVVRKIDVTSHPHTLHASHGKLAYHALWTSY